MDSVGTAPGTVRGKTNECLSNKPKRKNFLDLISNKLSILIIHRDTELKKSKILNHFDYTVVIKKNSPSFFL